jgi:hypothetical protein
MSQHVEEPRRKVRHQIRSKVLSREGSTLYLQCRHSISNYNDPTPVSAHCKDCEQESVWISMINAKEYAL